MLSGSLERGAPVFDFLPSLSSASPSRLLVQGGLITVNGSGLNASYLASNRTIECASNGGSTSGGGAYSGLTFDIFANRSMRVVSLSVWSVEGGGRAWVMARKRTSCASGGNCGHDSWDGSGVSDAFWEFVGEGVREGTPLPRGQATLSLFDPSSRRDLEGYRLAPGERRGFAVLSTHGILAGNASMNPCPKGAGDGCTVFSDEFAAVEPGMVLSGGAEPPGGGPAWQHVATGTRLAPAFLAGEVRYVNEQVASLEETKKATCTAGLFWVVLGVLGCLGFRR